jgi:hypothetical protein
VLPVSKKRFITILTFVAGLYFFLEFVIPGIAPGTGAKGTVQRIDWGSVTYRPYDGRAETHRDEPVLESGKGRPEALEIKKRNALDEMIVCDLSQLRPGDVITVGPDESETYGERPSITIGPDGSDPAVRIDENGQVRFGGARAAISSTRPLKIERGQAYIWHVTRYCSTPVQTGDVIRGTWYDDMNIDFTDVVTITADRVLLRPSGNGNEKPREFAKFGPNDTLILGAPVVTHRRPVRLGLVEIHGGKATLSTGETYDLTKDAITITPPEREGEAPRVRVGQTTLLLPAKEGLYRFTSTPYKHRIRADEHIEITPKAIVVSKRGIVTKVVPTVLHIKTHGAVRSRAVTGSTLILRRSDVPLLVGTLSISQPRLDEASATKLAVGDTVQIGQTTYLTRWLAPVGDYLMVVGTFGVGLGMFNLLRLHGGTIRRRKGNWPYSVIFVISLFTMLVFAGFANSPKTSLCYKIYDVLFDGMLNPMVSTTFSLLAFYLASASYRAFKIKTAEAAMMSVSAAIVMMGQVPIGIWLTHGLPPYLHLEVASEWIQVVALTSAYRAILLGVMVGAVAMALRLWLNLERNAFFDQEL